MGTWKRLFHHFSDAQLRRIIIWASGIFLCSLTVISLGWNCKRLEQATLELAAQNARSQYKKDLIYRRWASIHGGVYVPPTEATPPNPYLTFVAERDITTTSGKALTLVNPAYMTRQVHELGKKDYGDRGHITSLKPIRPENAPDPWEVEALKAFEKGKEEVLSISEFEGETYLRLMRPMVTESSCLKCHEQQGYKIGEIRGGISVSVPLAPYLASTATFSLGIRAVHAFVFIIICGGLFWINRLLNLSAVENEALQIQLHQAQKMESIGRLAGGVAHDFNNMLNVILGYSEIAARKLPSDHPQQRYMSEITKAAKRSADLTRQLLAFARKQPALPKILDLNKTVDSMLSILKRLIGESISLTFEPGQGLLNIKIDPVQVDQILANLCVNARDAIGDRLGRITIRTSMQTIDEEFCEIHPGFIVGTYVTLSVSDNGCGIEKKSLANIFEPFYTTKGLHHGTGLGLATVYGIVKQNGGYIEVESQPGEGATFRIFFSRHTEEKPVEAENPPVETQKGCETILLVEDEPALLKMTEAMLIQQGYTVISESSPAEALKKANSGECFHMLLTDVIMPEMTGSDLAAEIRKNNPQIKIVFMSGYASNIISPHIAMQEGIFFIQKPFTTTQLAEIIRASFNSPQPKRIP